MPVSTKFETTPTISVYHFKVVSSFKLLRLYALIVYYMLGLLQVDFFDFNWFLTLSLLSHISLFPIQLLQSIWEQVTADLLQHS